MSWTEATLRGTFQAHISAEPFQTLLEPSDTSRNPHNSAQGSSLPNTSITSPQPQLRVFVRPVIPRLQWRIALDVVEAQAIPLPEYHPSPNHAVGFWPQKESPFRLSVYFSYLLAKHWRSHICKTCDITRCASLQRWAPSLSNKNLSWQIQLLCRCLCFPQDLVRYLTPSQQKS